MEDLRTELEALKKVAAEQDKRILKLEQIEQMLDERERKNKSNLEKQKISLVKREELTKKIRELKSISEEQMKVFRKSVPLADSEAQAHKLFMVYIFSPNEATYLSLKEAFEEKRKYIEGTFIPVWADLQMIISRGGNFKLFEDGTLPVTPLVLIINQSGDVESIMLGREEIHDFLTKGGRSE